MTDHEAEEKGYSERLYGSQLPNSCCLVMHSFGGGAEKVALLLARELVLRGWAVSIACLRKSSKLARHVPAAVRIFMPESPGHLASLRFLGRLRTISDSRPLSSAPLSCRAFLWQRSLPRGDP